MEFKQEPLEAGCENIKINLKTKLDIYVGQIRETLDPSGKTLLCVVTEVSSVKVTDGAITLDAKMQPIHMINPK